MEAELFHAGGRTDGQTDMTQLVIAFCNFVEAPKRLRKPLHCGQGDSIGSLRTCLLQGPDLPAGSSHTLIAAASLSCLTQRDFTYSLLTLIMREERIPTRCNNIDDLLSIADVDY